MNEVVSEFLSHVGFKMRELLQEGSKQLHLAREQQVLIYSVFFFELPHQNELSKVYNHCLQGLL